MGISIQKKFGASVRDFRIKTGLSQEKFSLKIGMDRTYFASVESGKRNLSIANIQKIADGLEISLTELFSAVDNYKEEEND